jgi:hypothetical protein
MPEDYADRATPDTRRERCDQLAEISRQTPFPNRADDKRFGEAAGPDAPMTIWSIGEQRSFPLFRHDEKGGWRRRLALTGIGAQQT